MSQEIEQANSSKDSADNQPQKPQPQSAEVYRPKRWVPVLFVLGLLTVGAGGVWFILWASRAFTEPTAALTFIMGSIISLFLLLSTVATTCIYWGQRNIMLQQWKAMNENIARTDVIIARMGIQNAAMEWQAEISEIQTRLVEQQVGAMKEQLEAMRGQLDAMNEQAVIMRDSLTQAQKQLEHLAVIDRAYIEIVEMRMGALKVDEMVIIKTVCQTQN